MRLFRSKSIANTQKNGAGAGASAGIDKDSFSTIDLALPATTDPVKIVEQYNSSKINATGSGSSGMTVIAGGKSRTLNCRHIRKKHTVHGHIALGAWNRLLSL